MGEEANKSPPDDPLSYYARWRKEERNNNSNLLWENIENSHSYAVRYGSGKSISDKKIQVQVDLSHSTLAQFFIVVSSTIQSITVQSIGEILQFGAARRIGSMSSAAGTILEVAPPQREKRLSLEESRIVSDSLLLFYVHAIGVIDAFSIAFHRLFNSRLRSSERKADLIEKRFRKDLGVGQLDSIFEVNDAWLVRLKETLRNRYVHRIPPYVPDGRFTSEEAQAHQELERKKFAQLATGKVDGVDALELQQSALGKFWPVLAFTESSELMHLYPTLPDDAFRFNCLVFDLLDVILPLLQHADTKQA